MTRVVGVSSTDLPDAESLLNLHYEIVNVDTGISAQEIQAYRDQGLGVNVYTIDEGWLFSQYWLSGVTSVTTNNVQTFSQMQKPYLNLPYSRYLLFWGVYGIIIAIWLASSQPGLEKKPDAPVQPPDLMDFADPNEIPEISESSTAMVEPEKPVDEVAAEAPDLEQPEGVEELESREALDNIEGLEDQEEQETHEEDS